MNIDILHRHTGAVLYTASLPDTTTLTHAQRLGLAVQQSVAAGVSLAHADLVGVYLVASACGASTLRIPTCATPTCATPTARVAIL